jgi:hypothetical protein
MLDCSRVTLRLSSALVVVAALGAGCGGSTTNPSGTGGASGAGGASGSGGASTGGDAGSGGTSTGGSGGSGAVGGTSSACVTGDDCLPSQMCGYPVAEACVAQGQCFPAPGAVCNGYSPGCACDGSTINIVCTGLPDGYATQPLAHPGECAAMDAGTSFPCGSQLTCDSSTQYCKVASGGPCCNPPSYSCETIPTSCAMDHSCGCIQTAVGAQTCSEADGGVTVQFLYP